MIAAHGRGGEGGLDELEDALYRELVDSVQRGVCRFEAWRLVLIHHASIFALREKGM